MFRRAVLFIILLTLGVLLSGCGSGPEGVANNFVKAVKASKYADAAGYLSKELLYRYDNGNVEDSTKWFAERCLDPELNSDYKIEENSENSAKVVSSSDNGDYMVLMQEEGKWVIVEIGYREVLDETESIEYNTEYISDDSMWEGMERVDKDGQTGERTLSVTYDYINGEQVNRSAQPGDVIKEPVAQKIRRGTKPRALGVTLNIVPNSKNPCHPESTHQPNPNI